MSGPKGPALTIVAGCALLVLSVVLLDLAGYWFVYQGTVCYQPCSPYVGLVDRPWIPFWVTGLLIAVALLPLLDVVAERRFTRIVGLAASITVAAFPWVWFASDPLDGGPGWPGGPTVYGTSGPWAEYAPVIIVALAAAGGGMNAYGLCRPRRSTAQPAPAMPG